MDNNLIRADAQIARLYNNKKTAYDNYPLRFFGFYIPFVVYQCRDTQLAHLIK